MGVKVDFKVNVPYGEMDITENGQYDVSDYAIANVNVAFETEEKSVTITENGTQEVLPDEGKVLNEVSITTNVPQDNTLKKLLDNTKTTSYLFYKYTGDDINTLIQYNDTSEVTNMTRMYQQCGATTVPVLNTSKVTNMQEMFWLSSNLTTVPAYDCTNVTDMSRMFVGCRSLKSILMTNIGVSLDISASTKFEREDLVLILNNLKTVTTTQTLKMGATNLARLTDEDKLIATNKGWTLA